MSRTAKGAGTGPGTEAREGARQGEGEAVRKGGAAPPREAVTIALLLVLPAELLLLDGNLSVPQLVARVAGALALTWLAASVIGGTVRSARRSLARTRAEAAAEEARARREEREARKAAKAAAAAAEAEPPEAQPLAAEVSGAAYGLAGE